VKPFPSRDIHLGATYEDTDIRNETGDIYALPPDLERFFPDRFVRDLSGRLVAVTFQPTNFYRERRRTLNMTVSANGAVGKRQAKAGDKKGSGDGRAHYYAGAGPSIRFSDRLQIRQGIPVLDLLRGDSVTGGGTSRVTGYFYGGIGYLGNDLSINGWYQAGERVRSDIPASDLFFSFIFKLNIGVGISVHHFTPKLDWTHHMQLKIDVENVTDAHVHVHDRNGRVPNRFQDDYLDPIGRIAKLTLRKLF
jgi:iron complex outermembrane recepter protein